MLVQNGGPRLDLLNGDAIGSSGGQSRHEFEAQAGYTNNGLGFRFSGNYRTGTEVNGGTPGAPQSLNFSGLGTLDLRLFADFGQRLDLVKKHPWLRGTRLTIGVTNIFDGKQRVTDANGVTPVSYQPDYLDPLGRSVRISLRKLFF
ncbi:TonB-dependent receptor [hydrothermal vent metagenome]|uniref:TonB-dependent receptor n=1 Tax=hydrothermal vent metagenome TaxID=652676 RepID=A0A161KEM0_9ZZZZ